MGELAFVGAMAFSESQRVLSPLERLSQYDDFTVYHHSGDERIKPGINGRYIHEAPPEVQRMIVKEYKKLGTSAVRLLLKDDLEPELGMFNLNYLDRVVKFSGILREEIEDAEVIVPFMDFWGMMNRVWFGGGITATCPYQKHRGKTDSEVHDGLRIFYEDETLQGHYNRRCEVIINYLLRNGVPVVWEVANEPELRGHKEQFSAWMNEKARFIKSLDPNAMVLPGVANPLDLDAQDFDATTAHIYPDRLDLRALFSFMKESEKPVVLEEIGMFSPLLGLEDSLLAEYMLFVFENASNIDANKKTIIPGFSAMYIWQMSHERDMFLFNLRNMPKSAATFRKINEVLRRAA